MLSSDPLSALDVLRQLRVAAPLSKPLVARTIAALANARDAAALSALAEELNEHTDLAQLTLVASDAAAATALAQQRPGELAIASAQFAAAARLLRRRTTTDIAWASADVTNVALVACDALRDATARLGAHVAPTVKLEFAARTHWRYALAILAEIDAEGPTRVSAFFACTFSLSNLTHVRTHTLSNWRVVPVTLFGAHWPYHDRPIQLSMPKRATMATNLPLSASAAPVVRSTSSFMPCRVLCALHVRVAVQSTPMTAIPTTTTTPRVMTIPIAATK